MIRQICDVCNKLVTEEDPCDCIVNKWLSIIFDTVTKTWLIAAQSSTQEEAMDFEENTNSPCITIWSGDFIEHP